MSSPAATKGSDSLKLRDDTTRFLCGAAHRDEEFADSAIRGYPVEVARSIPRLPGVKPQEARTRRKVRDNMLLVPPASSHAGSGLLLAPWQLVGGTVALVARAWIRLGRCGRRVLPHERGPLAMAGMIALFFVLYKFTDESSNYSRHYDEYGLESGRGLGES